MSPRPSHGAPVPACLTALLAAFWPWTAARAAAAPAAAAAAAAGRPAPAAGGTEYLSSFPRLGSAIPAEEFAARFERHGAVLLRFDATPTVLQDAFPTLDRHLEDQGVFRIKMSSSDNVSANPANVSTGVSPLRMRFTDHAVLAPADNTVQGPHQEGASASRGNRKVIVFLCERPAESGGGTALFDMQRAWELLPPDLQVRLAGASFGFPQHNGMVLEVPAAVRHDVTGAACLQFYCFGRTRRDCVDVYRQRTGRYHVRPDPYQYEMHAEHDVLLIDADGTRRPFVGLDLYRMLNSVYGAMIAHTWSAGEALVVDNIRWAHARLDGSGTGRKVHFFYYGRRDRPLDLHQLRRPSP